MYSGSKVRTGDVTVISVVRIFGSNINCIRSRSTSTAFYLTHAFETFTTLWSTFLFVACWFTFSLLAHSVFQCTSWWITIRNTFAIDTFSISVVLGLACRLIAVRNTFAIYTLSISIVLGFAYWLVTVRNTFAIDTLSISIVLGFACWLIAVRNTFAIYTLSISIVLGIACWFVTVRDAFTIDTFSITMVFCFAC